MQTANILEARKLKKYYPIYTGLLQRHTADVKALESVDLVIPRGSTVGLVGESGCGKSTLARLVLMLESPSAGDILFEGKDLLGLRATERMEFRRKVQVVFQDPFASLNPRMTVEQILADPLLVHFGHYEQQRLIALLEEVGLGAEALQRFPHQFSGGQRQRLCIARALTLDPELIVCDEAVSALDVSVQAQILNLLVNLQQSRGLSLLFISHDLGVVNYISDYIGVMYLGQIVEFGTAQDVFHHSKHPYTRALMNAQPLIRAFHESQPSSRKATPTKISGEIPSPINPPSGCYFHTRCPFKREECTKGTFELFQLPEIASHYSRCPFYKHIGY